MSRFFIPRWIWTAVAAILAIALLLVIFRLGNQASAGVSLSDPVVWVEDGSNGRLLQINGSTREITAEVSVGSDGDSIVAFPRGRDAVYLNRTTGELGVVGAISLDVDNVSPLAGQSGPIRGSQLEMLADYEASEWTNAYILDDDRTLVFEPGGGLRRDIPNGELGSTAINADGQMVTVTGDASLVGITTDRGLETLITLPALISPDAQHPGLVRSGDSMYLVDSERRVVNEILGQEDLGPTVSICGSLENVQMSGNTLTSSDGDHRILVHDSEAGLLSVSEPAESDCVQIVLGETGTNWGPPVAVDATAYLPNYDNGEILVVDLEERVVLDSFTFGSGNGVPFELEVFDGAVWANEPQGIRAAVVSRDEIQEIFKLGSVSIGGENTDGEGDVGQIVSGAEDDELRGFGREGELFRFDDGGDSGENGGGEDIGVDGEGEGGDATVDGEAPGDADPTEDQLPVDLPNTPLIVPVEQELTEVLDELIANFVFSADTVNVGEEVVLSDESSGGPTSWNWDFGDGTSGAGPEVSKVWDSEGLFTVTLFVSNAAGDQAQQTHEFTVVAVDVLRVPTANFSFGSETIEVGDEIVFTSTSTGDPDTLIWDFGDGTTAAGEQVAHQFTEPGVYPVTLTASNAAGPNTSTALITVVEGVQPPEAKIGRFPGVVEVGQSVTLNSESTNSPTAISWGFDDGDTALGTTVRHAWDAPGTYRIRLSVSNSAGADEDFADIVVEPRVNPPVARFGESTLEIVQGETISFSDLSLNSPTSLSWEFGDGSTAQGANVAHSWDDPGTYTVTLTATNGAGSDSASKTVTVIPLPPNPPTAAFTIPNATVPVNSVVNFTDTSTGDPTSWAWTFGDGTSSTAQNPPHGFATPGTYTVTLTATNAGGSTSISKQIVVVDPPIASFTQAADELDVVFTDTTTNSPTSWEWDFGDGTSSTAQNPSKTYPTAGTYIVTLIATNDAGSSAPFTTTIDVVKRPVAAFTVTTGGLTAQFDNDSFDNPTNSTWDFGDGTTSSSPNPTHTFAASGTYTVTLTASNSAGSDSTSQDVTVALAPPVANFTCNVIGGGVACDGSSSTSATLYSWSAPGSIAQNGVTTDSPSFTYAATGSYDITLTVENSEGLTDSATQTVSVVVPEPPTITNLSVLTNIDGVVELTASASNSPDSWTWTAPGGSISGGTSSTPTITYTADGPVTVTATATNAVGTSAPESIDFTIDLSSPPVLNAITETSNSGGVIGLAANVSNGPVDYAWSAPVGTLSSTTNATPTLTVTANGTYTVNLTITNPDGSDTGSQTFTVTDIVAPLTIASVNQTEAPAGSVALSTTDTGNPTGWSWNVGGSNEGSSTSPTPTFTFGANGNYSGSVTISKAGTAPVTELFTVVVSGLPGPPPVASFTFSPDNAAAPAAVTFNSAGSTAEPGATFTWNFGDGSTGTGATATHTYANPGTYSATLTVTNPDTQSSTTPAQTVTVS